MGAIIENDFVIRFSNVNGTGSASANALFAKAVFRMGIPMNPKNIFPSNIQGLPTWYEVRVNGDGYLARREGIDILVSVNPQSLQGDIDSLSPGGYLIYDNSKYLQQKFLRDDINFIGVPMMQLSMAHFDKARHQQLFKNVIYIGAVAALLDIELEVIETLIEERFHGKDKLIEANKLALHTGVNYVKEHIMEPFRFKLRRLDKLGDKIVLDGNSAAALGLLYGGATVCAWYPITPSTSLAGAFGKYAKKYRKDPETGKYKFASIQAEDELAAVGMGLGANWNGARAFTATSGAGVSLMNEFIGFAYYAELPMTIVNVMRGGPSTGMPTRTQQGDILSSAYASHGDTKHPMLIPSDPRECFEMGAQCLDLADRLQTLIFLMMDLDLGMNDHISSPLHWDKDRKYDRGKLVSKKDLDEWKEWGRFIDFDEDGISYRSLPGVHPTKGAYVTRGTSKNRMGSYSERGDDYVENMDRLARKWETAKTMVPSPEISIDDESGRVGIIYYGTSRHATEEALDMRRQEGRHYNSMRLRAFPFSSDVNDFIERHEKVYVIEQNRDAQMRSLLINELDIVPSKLLKVLHFNGTPITAYDILKQLD